MKAKNVKTIFKEFIRKIHTLYSGIILNFPAYNKSFIVEKSAQAQDAPVIIESINPTAKNLFVCLILCLFEL